MAAALKDPQQGAVTSINCAVNPVLNSQQHLYYAECFASQNATVSE